MNRSEKRPWLSAVVNGTLVALAFGLLAFVIWQNRDKIREVLARPLDFKQFAFAWLVYMIGITGTFVRWHALVRVIEPRFRFRSTVVLGFVGIVFNLVIPGAVGGDMIKAGYLLRMRIRKTQAVASMVIDRILGLLGLFIIAAVAGGIAWGQAPSDVRKLITVSWIALGLGLLALVVIFSPTLSRLIPPSLSRGTRLEPIVSELHEMSRTYRGRLGVVLWATILSIFGHCMNVLAFYLVGVMLFPTMPTTLGEHFVTVPLTLFSTAVPLPFGALGLSEEVGQQLLKLVGHPSGALAMIGFRVLMYAGGLLGACVYLWNLKEIRDLTDTARHLDDEDPPGGLDQAVAEH
jgi:uncharacterized protein (TIRG00374 family)